MSYNAEVWTIPRCWVILWPFLLWPFLLWQLKHRQIHTIIHSPKKCSNSKQLEIVPVRRKFLCKLPSSYLAERNLTRGVTLFPHCGLSFRLLHQPLKVLQKKKTHKFIKSVAFYIKVKQSKNLNLNTKTFLLASLTFWRKTLKFWSFVEKFLDKPGPVNSYKLQMQVYFLKSKFFYDENKINLI